MDDMPIIFSYTRAQAIEDGVLVDVSDKAKEAGFNVPVALTDTLWHEWIVPSEKDEGNGQSVDGRLWDVLNVMAFTALGYEGRIMPFTVAFIKDGKKRHVKIKSIIGPGDNGEPVITVMMPHED